MGKSTLSLSSSGGGLFDGRPKTQTWVWDVFVFFRKPRKIAGPCTPECANPKGCISLAETANLPQLHTYVRANC